MRVPVAPNPAISEVEFSSSTIHITIPPISREVPMMYRLSRCLPISLGHQKCGIAVTTNAAITSPSGCRQRIAVRPACLAEKWKGTVRSVCENKPAGQRMAPN